MSTIVVHCFECGEALTFSERVGMREECTKCGADVHVCKNCRFYDPKVYNECLEPQAEVQRERDRANRCEFFQSRAGKVDSKGSDRDSLLAAAEALFKKKS